MFSKAIFLHGFSFMFCSFLSSQGNKILYRQGNGNDFYTIHIVVLSLNYSDHWEEKGESFRNNLSACFMRRPS